MAMSTASNNNATFGLVDSSEESTLTHVCLSLRGTAGKLEVCGFFCQPRFKRTNKQPAETAANPERSKTNIEIKGPGSGRERVSV